MTNIAINKEAITIQLDTEILSRMIDITTKFPRFSIDNIVEELIMDGIKALEEDLELGELCESRKDQKRLSHEEVWGLDKKEQ